MRQGMACLLEALRGESLERQRADIEWSEMLALAEEERVLPWVASLLRRQGNSLPEAIADRLDQVERDATIAAFFWSSQLKDLLRAFHQANLAVVPLKGPALAQRLYGSVSLRTNRDLDLLVRKVDFERAEAILANLGFVPGERDGYHRPWVRNRATVELHYDVENPLAFDFGVDSAIRNADPTDFHGEPCRQLVPQDELAYLCLHAARHRYDRLCLVLDLQLAFEKLGAASDGTGQRSEIVAMGSLVTLGLAMAHRLQPILQAKAVPASDFETQRMEDVANGLWNRLLNQSSQPMDWRGLHRFYGELERPGVSRLMRWIRHMRILATRTIEPDYRFAAEFGMHRIWQVRVLRPFRLLSAAFRSRSRTVE